MIVGGDGCAEEHEEDSERELSAFGLGVGERCESHETRGVYHVELVDQLPGIFQSGVEHEAAEAN